MKAVLLAGGFGTRISEETSIRPKPMVEIGDRPILWHIMKIYYAHGVRDFIICCGYKAYVIKEYFSNYALHVSDVTFDTKNNSVHMHGNNAEEWRITLVDTGESTMTGGRLKRVADYLDDEPFFMTYGDGVCDVDIGSVLDFHRDENVSATLVAVQPPGRFGVFTLAEDDTKIEHFREKPQGDNAWINGGFFVLNPNVLDHISGDDCVWEREPLEHLAETGQLAAYKHDGFWHPMDTLRDKKVLEQLWQSGNAPWKVW